MPKKYSETEKTNIRRDLRRAAQRSLFHKGVRGTSVEDLVRQAAIPKATFYLFYRTKEDLYIDVLTDFRTTMQDEMLSMLQELDENHIVSSLTTVFMHLVENIYRKGIYRLLAEDELAVATRKSEVDVVRREEDELIAFFRELFGFFAIEDKDDIAAFWSAFLAIVYSMEGAERMEKPLESWRLLIRGLMLQLVGE
ncbi:MAG: TetR/AcrR family transcriptional regulator [Spirochaetes bacterium]|uniref:TetR/AcrR family transcriptional regulator n=1 Tax=Candidatus Aphodenecus pullistercoris TaxID=2840669 RepID=A0A9D9E8M0_9SPIR|nr:TetR/AcrR family transcriptional regulator [Candidatus Aphodenecus pullistercoris]